MAESWTEMGEIALACAVGGGRQADGVVGTAYAAVESKAMSDASGRCGLVGCGDGGESRV
jgi:hypothetical protein